MNYMVFIWFFVVIPLSVIALLFVRFKWNEIKLEEEDLKTVRQGSPIEFKETEISKAREEAILGKSESKSGVEI